MLKIRQDRNPHTWKDGLYIEMGPWFNDKVLISVPQNLRVTLSLQKLGLYSNSLIFQSYLFNEVTLPVTKETISKLLLNGIFPSQ